MAMWRYAGSLDDIWAGEMRAVNFGAVDVLLCNLDGLLVAYQDRCPHLAKPLSEGVLSDGVLTCAAHEWEFDARTGRGVIASKAASSRSCRSRSSLILTGIPHPPDPRSAATWPGRVTPGS